MTEKYAPPKAWLIDIEGVLVADKRYEPVPGSVDWLNGIVAQGIPFCLVSNNTTHRPEDLIDQLRAVGFEVKQDQLAGALTLAVKWLRERSRRQIMWLGDPCMQEFWQDEGFELEAGGHCQAVVLGANAQLGIADLDEAVAPILDQGADLVCLHRNRFFLDDQGERRLGPGAWAAALESLGGSGQIVTVGKPAETIYNEALKMVGAEPGEVLFISDDPVADLVTARRMGMRTAFVLSGKHQDHSVLGRMEEEDWPHLICRCPADLGPAPDENAIKK